MRGLFFCDLLPQVNLKDICHQLVLTADFTMLADVCVACIP